jgi:DNA invertase Pin-like site-specific DNA recombinase
VGGSCRSLADFHNAPKADVAGMISARTKAALAAAKKRGRKLGGDRGSRLTVKARKSGNAAVARGAAARAADVAPIIAELQASGAESLRAIAAGLNARGIPTARGAGQWSAVQVAWVMERRAAN